MEFADLEGQLCCIILYKKLENPWMFVFLGDPGIKLPWIWRGDHQFISVSQSCPTLCNHMDCSTPGFPVHLQILEFIQTHVHWIGDAIQPSRPLSSPSSHLQYFPPSGSLQMSQFFASGGQSIGVSALAPVLPMNIQGWFPLGWTGWISLQSKRLSRVFFSTTVQKINSSALSFLYSPTLASVHDDWKNRNFD